MDFEKFDKHTSANRGLITSTQLKNVGSGPGSITHWTGKGRLVTVHNSVHRAAGAPVTFEQRCLAATLAGAPGCMTSHRAATEMWEMYDFGGEFVDVVVKRSRLPRLAGVHVHRARDLDRFHMTRLRGIPITPPTLTLIDLGAVASAEIVKEAMEQAFVKKLTTPAGLWAAYEIVARPGRRGAGVIRRLLEDRSLGMKASDSKSEVNFADLCRRFGLPDPVFHFRVIDADGVFVAEPDFSYPDRKILIEVDSVAYHGTADAMQRDLERQNKLVNLGWTVLRFTYHDVKYRPEYVAATVRRCLGASA